MKTKKFVGKLLVWTLTLALIMSMCSIFVSAADPAVTFSTSVSKAKAGEPVTITVKFADDLKFRNTRFTVKYDKSVFELDNSKFYVDDDGFDAHHDVTIYKEKGLCVINMDTANGELVYANVNTALNSGVGTVLSAKLYVKSGAPIGDTDITFDMKELENNGTAVPYSINATKKTVKIEAAPVDVSGISLDKSALELIVGDSADLTATVSPANATDKTVTWTTSNSAVATVVNGKVTGLKVGTAKITAKAGSKTAVCNVTVKKKPAVVATAIDIDDTLTLTIGDSKSLTATVTPAEAAGTITWKSSNKNIATVTSAGLVKAVGIGTAKITATIDGVSDECAVTVNGIGLNGIAIDPTAAELTVGGTKTLKVVYDPANTTDDKTVTWSSSDEAIATVSSSGKVNAIAEGTATITAKVGDKEATCAITVVKAPDVAVTGIKLDKSSITLKEGDKETLKATVSPKDATNKTVAWASSDEAIATVDENGVVTAVQKGVATITATTEDGDFEAKCTVSVITAEEYEEYVKTADASTYFIALIIALVSCTAMAALIITKKRQSVR